MARKRKKKRKNKAKTSRKKSRWMKLVKKHGIQKAKELYDKNAVKAAKESALMTGEKVTLIPTKYFASKSLRYIELGKGIWGRIGCPKGQWNPKVMYQGDRGKCLQGTILQAVWLPMKSKAWRTKQKKKFLKGAKRDLKRLQEGLVAGNPAGTEYYSDAEREEWLRSSGGNGMLTENPTLLVANPANPEFFDFDVVGRLLMTTSEKSYLDRHIDLARKVLRPKRLGRKTAMYKDPQRLLKIFSEAAQAAIKKGKKRYAAQLSDAFNLAIGVVRSQTGRIESLVNWYGIGSEMAKKVRSLDIYESWRDDRKREWEKGFKANPDIQPNPKKMKRALKKYKEFHGLDPAEIVVVEVPDYMDGEVLVGMGTTPDSTYTPPKHSKKGGSTYLHKYDEEPYLAIDPDGGTIHIVGGGFIVGPRGIEG